MWLTHDDKILSPDNVRRIGCIEVGGRKRFRPGVGSLKPGQRQFRENQNVRRCRRLCFCGQCGDAGDVVCDHGGGANCATAARDLRPRGIGLHEFTEIKGIVGFGD